MSERTWVFGCDGFVNFFGGGVRVAACTDSLRLAQNVGCLVLCCTARYHTVLEHIAAALCPPRGVLNHF